MRGEAREPAVFDAGPLIYLDALGYLVTLRELHRVIIPEAVARELEERPGAPGGSVPSLEWIERRTPAAESIYRVVSEPPAIDAGERETIAIALEIGSEATAVIDDRRGRRRARSLKVPLTGTLGVLQALHRVGLANRTLAEDFDALGEAGMYLTEDLKRRMVDRLSAGEAPHERN
jgi:predicted nucleic acid-binding protein